MNIEKNKAFDELFNEYGIEENEVSAAAEKYGLEKDPEFNAQM